MSPSTTASPGGPWPMRGRTDHERTSADAARRSATCLPCGHARARRRDASAFRNTGIATVDPWTAAPGSAPPVNSLGFGMKKPFTAPIIAEPGAVRDAHAARFNDDIEAIFRDLRAMQEEFGYAFVRYPSRPAVPSDDGKGSWCTPAARSRMSVTTWIRAGPSRQRASSKAGAKSCVRSTRQDGAP